MSPEWRPAWERFKTPEARRGRTNDAITALEREGYLEAHIARFLRHLLDFANARGGVRIGAEKFGQVIQRCKKRVLQLEAIAVEQGWLQLVQRGGGKHRANHFIFKIGVWRDEAADPAAQVHFSERVKAELRDAFWDFVDWYRWHHDNESCSPDCWRYAPREAREPAIAWQT